MPARRGGRTGHVTVRRHKELLAPYLLLLVIGEYESQRQSPDEDVDFLGAYTSSQGFASRSAVVHKVVRLLRASGARRWL